MGRVILASVLAAIVAAPQVQPPRQPTRPTNPTTPTNPQRPTPGQARPNPRVRSATGDALERYAAGEYERAVATLTLVGGFNVEQADTWIRARGEGETARRRLVAATLVLDVAAAKDAWPSATVEWVCETLRNAGTATESEEVWLRASIALAEGEGMWPFLTTGGHIGHARARFPDNPHFKLASAVAAEASTLPKAGASTAGLRGEAVAFDLFAAELVEVSGAKGSQTASLQHALAELEPLTSDPTVGAEARARIGVIELRLGHAERALDEFRRAEASSPDRFSKYVARLYTGWALARAGRTDEAITAYRSALDAVPHARLATTLLTSLLFMNHRIVETEALVDDYLARSVSADDPWWWYQLGDYREYQALLTRLREAIR